MVTKAQTLLRAVFPGESEMAVRMRAVDWSSTELGPPQRWPENLRSAVRLCLASRFPICLWWGRDLAFLYNDAFLPLLREARHPHALMQRGHEVWSDIWSTIGPALEGVLATGKATWSEDTPLYYDRNIPKEEVYVTWSFTPVLAADGHSVQGVFCPCTETTDRVVGARRLETLRKLGLRARGTRTVEAACATAARVLAENPSDVPFSAIYVVDETGTRAVLESVAGLTKDNQPFPSTVSSSETVPSPWPLATVLQTRAAAQVSDLLERGVRLPGGPWPEPASMAVALPLFSHQERPCGLAVLGVGPRRVLDEAYRTFFETVAGHIGTAIGDAEAYQLEMRRADALAELDRARAVSFAEVSHESHAALTLMLGPIQEMLAHAGPASAGFGAEVGLVRRNTLRLLELVNTLLASVDTAAIGEEARRRLPESDGEPAARPAAVPPAGAGRETTGRPRLRRMEDDRQRLLTDVAETRDLFLQIAETIPDSVYLYDLVEARTIYTNGRSELVIGYPVSQVMALGQRFAPTLWHPDDVPRLPDYRRRLQELADGEIAELEYRTRQPDGSYRWLRSRVAVFARTPDGNVRQVIVITQNVTERKRAEEALRESDERFRRYFELGLIGMAISSPSKGILEVNDELCKIFGYPRDDLLRTSWAALTHPEDLAADVAQFERVMTGEMDGYSIGKRFIRKDGQVIDATVSVKCLRSSDGSVDYFVALVQDVTDRRRAEEELRRARDELERRVAARTRLLSASNEELVKQIAERWRAEAHLTYQANLLDNVQEAILATDENLKVTAWNRAAERMYGWKAEETIGRSAPEVLRSEWDDGQRAEVFRTLAESGHYHAEVVQHRRNGSRFHVQAGIIALRDEAGRITGYVGTCRDVTERRHAEEELRRSEANLAEAQRISHIGSWNWNVTTGELFWSPEHFRIFGFEVGSFRPTMENTRHLIHPEDRVRVQEVLDRAVREGSDFEMDFRIVLPDGSLKYLHGLGHPTTRDSQGLEYVGSTMDLTERKHAEEALQKAQAELAHVARVATLGELSALVAHEINQPLAAMVAHGHACLRWLDREEPDVEEAKEAVSGILRDAGRASEVIERIRNHLKKADVQKTTLDLNGVVQGVLTVARSEVARNEVAVELDLAEGLPAVLGDRVQLEQVVLNLVMNAVEAMKMVTGRRRRLSIETRRDQAGHVMVRVGDSGDGAEPGHLERMFEPFFTTKREGLGMGLAISRSIVAGHGGRIWASAHEGPGLSMSFSLPGVPS